MCVCVDRVVERVAGAHVGEKTRRRRGAGGGRERMACINGRNTREGRGVAGSMAGGGAPPPPPGDCDPHAERGEQGQHRVDILGIVFFCKISSGVQPRVKFPRHLELLQKFKQWVLRGAVTSERRGSSMRREEVYM